jgi:lysozyme
MRASEAALDLIKRCESLKLEAYLCPAGIPTIGYGHTAGVVVPSTTTLDQAEAFLHEDVAFAERLVNQRVKVSLTQGQFDALVSFVFNIRNPEVQFTEANCTLLRKLNAGDYDGAAAEFGRWTHAGQTVLAGLVTRRAKEAALFKGQVA